MFLAVFYALLKEPLGAKNVEFSRRLSCFGQPDLQSTALATWQRRLMHRENVFAAGWSIRIEGKAWGNHPLFELATPPSG
jgi:hypothetical protein